jgi:hypothetical protein
MIIHPDHGGDTFLLTVGCYKSRTASHPRRRHYIVTAVKNLKSFHVYFFTSILSEDFFHFSSCNLVKLRQLSRYRDELRDLAGVRFQVAARVFLLIEKVQIISVAHPVSYPMDTSEFLP